MKNNAINTYLKDLSKQLCCSEKEKKEILSSLKNRLSEFESEYPTALKYEDIVEQFGSPKEVANSFLGEYSSIQLHNLVKRRKIKHFCIITACILIFAALLSIQSAEFIGFICFRMGMPLKLCMMVQIYLVPKKLVLPIIELINKGSIFHLQDGGTF